MRQILFAAYLLLLCSVQNVCAQHYAHVTATTSNAQNGLVYLSGDANAVPQYQSSLTIKNYDLEEYGKSYYYYGWAKADRGYAFSGWEATMTNVKTEGSKSARVDSNTGVADRLFIGPSQMSADKSKPSLITFTANWEKIQGYNVTYVQPQYGSYSVSYSYEKINNGAATAMNDTYSMLETTADKVVESYPSDVITLSTTLSTFLGWYEVGVTGAETLLSTSGSFVYTASKDVRIVAKFEAPKEYKAAVISNGQTTQYKSFDEAVNAANNLTNNPTIQLLDNNLDVSSAFSILNTMTIDLNGQTLSSSKSPFISVGSQSAVLTIVDSQVSGAKSLSGMKEAAIVGTILVSSNEVESLDGLAVVKGSLVLDGVMVKVVNTSSSASASATAVNVSVGQQFRSQDASLSATSSSKACVLRLGRTSTADICGGILSATTTTGSDAYAVYAASQCTTNLKYATLSATAATSNAVALCSEGNTIVEDCDITASSASSVSYAVLAAQGTTTINSGAFTVNNNGAKTDIQQTDGRLFVNGGVYAHSFDLYKYLSDDVTIYEIPSSDPRYAAGLRYDVVAFADVKNVAKIGNQYYDTLEEALAAAKSDDFVFLTQNYKLSQPVTVKNGVTLYIPFSAECISQYDTDGVKYVVEPKTVTEASDINPYRTLTMTDNSSIEVLGSLVAGGATYLTNQQMNKTIGCPGSTTGTYGRIDMSKGGHILVNSGAGLYVWGYISGQSQSEGNNLIDAGSIEVLDGGKVYESFVIGDWRGGGNTACIGNDPTYRVFPFKQYFIPNVEVPMTINYGGEEIAVMSLYGDNSKLMVNANLVGMNNSLFNLVSMGSKLIKHYDPQTDRQYFTLNGEVEFSEINIKVNSDLTVRSSDFVFPISSSFTFACNDCELSIPYDVEMLPGSEILVDQTSKLNLQGNIYVYDVDNWDKYIGSTDRYFTSLTVRPTDHYLNDSWTSKSSLNDAHIHVDGNVIVDGALYTTTAGAAVTSNGGGSIKFIKPAEGQYTFQVLGNGSKKTDYKINDYKRNESTTYTGPYCTPVSVVSAMLHSTDGTYCQTTGISGETVFVNDNGKWSKEGGTTSVDAVTTTSDNNVNTIHTIQGITVSAAKTPGLYIVNGKKRLVR